MSDASILRHYLAPLEPLLHAEDVTELVVNRAGEIGVESAKGWTWFERPELTSAWLTTLAVAAAAFTRQDVSASQPLCSTILPGGERCQIVMSPAAEGDGVSLTIRKPSHRSLDIDQLGEAGLFDLARPAGSDLHPSEYELLDLQAAGDWLAFFRLAVRSRRNILVSGATGSGKTTLAKALIRLIPIEERLVTLEDTRELTAPHRNLVHLIYAKDGQGVSKAGPKDLLAAALRMRPDRILLQELRDEIAFSYLRSATSGHPGSITTLHADSPALAFEQLTLLVRESEAGRDLPRADIRALLLAVVDVVVQLRRIDGRFRMTEVWYDPLGKRRSAT